MGDYEALIERIEPCERCDRWTPEGTQPCLRCWPAIVVTDAGTKIVREPDRD